MSKGARDKPLQCQEDKIMVHQVRTLGSSSTRRSFLRTGLAAPGAIGTALIANHLPSEALADSELTFGSIGPTEALHFQVWHDKAGNAPAVTDPTNGLVFPDLSKPPFNGNEDLQANLIMPEPTVFLSRSFPVCSIVRPTETQGAAMGAVRFLTAMGLFTGQSTAFFAELNALATNADLAQRRV
jgi:hypothetical protein